IALLAGSDTGLALALEAQLAGLHAELKGGPAPASAIERLLAERAALSWLEAHHYSLLAARTAEATGRWAAAVQKRQAAAHRRYLGALRSLAAAQSHLRAAKNSGAKRRRGERCF